MHDPHSLWSPCSSVLGRSMKATCSLWSSISSQLWWLMLSSWTRNMSFYGPRCFIYLAWERNHATYIVHNYVLSKDIYLFMFMDTINFCLCSFGARPCNDINLKWIASLVVARVSCMHNVLLMKEYTCKGNIWPYCFFKYDNLSIHHILLVSFFK